MTTSITEIIFNSVIFTLFGIFVLVSYWIYLRDDESKSYLTNKYWFNLNSTIIFILMIFQFLAAFGFLTAVISWIIEPPEGGTFASSSWYFFTFVIVFFLFSALWSFAVYNNYKILTIFSLIVVAIFSILLLAMSVEETNPRWYITLGLLFLCITTVLGDAVIWNANYILKNN